MPSGGVEVPYRERERSVTMEPLYGTEAMSEGEPSGGLSDELLTINIGPHHPATHGVLRLLTTLQGEVVRDVKPIIGYVHTGIEKSCEDQQYWKAITFIERMDYLAYYYNALAFCMSVERLAQVEVPRARAVAARDPPRAEPDRQPPLLDRHRGARHRRDHDALVGLPRPRLRPRPVRDVGRPAPAHALLPGGRRGGGHPAGLRAEGARVPRDHAAPDRPVRVAARPQRDLAAAHEGHRHRAGGAAARARRDRPAAAGVRQLLGPAQGDALLVYEQFDFKVPVGSVGDNYDRYKVRLTEMRESLKIVEQAIDGLPEGPVHHRPTASSRCRRATSWPPRWRR